MEDAQYRLSSGRELGFDQTVYDDRGEQLGTIRGFDESGFYVRAAGELATEVETSGSHGAGEMDLMWRCWACGELGRIDSLPEACPSCGAPKEDLYYWTED
ncbi:rubredoxin-like domain-containing protein [Halococcus sp. IIIV-5B]|uniref:DUF7130 family rubredoxin-like protein n=1 Tax=Halococcus sp. IIIV-5B TaxID=2321230 RepID=UPI000E767A50|nr:hypothetical protein [Halococcus sp. IIIV-5B]RJS98615.1 hypothetical protein D3261_16685 [Halococcus sp. IIIV-5B]